MLQSSGHVKIKPIIIVDSVVDYIKCVNDDCKKSSGKNSMVNKLILFLSRYYYIYGTVIFPFSQFNSMMNFTVKFNRLTVLPFGKEHSY